MVRIQHHHFYFKGGFERKSRLHSQKCIFSFTNRWSGIFQKNANITIYEFFDYNCGYCKSVLKVILETLAEDKKINFDFVEYPILSQESYTASIAALASKKQGLYSDFHSSLMRLKGRIS